MAGGEGRLSRWSRLKRKGGADDREERAAVGEAEARREAVRTQPEAVNLPGGARVRNFVPAMAPLAPALEDDDDRFTRGVGHVEQAETETATDTAVVPPDGDPVYDTEDLFAGIEEAELSDEEKAVVADLPPLESLKAESDFTPFLKEGVPEFLKRRALRLLWRSNPLFGFRDGLNDYDEDYNAIFKTIDSLTGNYKVGRGHLSEEELQKMTPEEAKRAFDEEEEDEGEEELAEATAAAPEDGDGAPDGASPDDEDDEIGDGEDEPPV